MSAGAPCRILDWDSQHFRLRIARVEAARLNPGGLRDVIAWCVAERIDCVYFLAQPGDAESERLAEAAGFRKADLRVTLERENAAPGDPVDPGFVRPYQSGDLPRLQEIARTQFTDTRFYRDPGFDRERCRELYEIWISKACGGGAPLVLVAVQDREASGFLTGQVAGEGKIDLVAVAGTAQGKGLGRALIREALRWFASQPLRLVSVVTQGTNSAARRLYETCGFRIRSEQSYFHGWFGSGGGLVR